MGRLLSVIVGIWIGWNAMSTVGAALRDVLLGGFVVALITVTFYLKSLLRPSPDSVAETMLPMPLALYVRTGKALWRGELGWFELTWHSVRIFFLGSVWIGVVGVLTHLVKGYFS